MMQGIVLGECENLVTLILFFEDGYVIEIGRLVLNYVNNFKDGRCFF